jgi:SAM-dependent methyltransferase
VAGRRILDVGCGAGPLLAALRERGAVVTGVDSSTKMLELARERLGDGADLHPADLSNPLPFPDGAFDDVIACLVLHYLEDWTAPLTELRRVLAPGGRLIVAVNHPLVNKLADPDADYFATRKFSYEHTFSGQNAVLTYWHRPLHAMTGAFTEAGFRLAFARRVKGGVGQGEVGRRCRPGSAKRVGCPAGPVVRQADEAPWCGRLSCAPSGWPARAGGKLGCAVARHSCHGRHRPRLCRAKR